MEPIDDEKFEKMQGCVAEGIKVTVLFAAALALGMFFKNCLGW